MKSSKWICSKGNFPGKLGLVSQGILLNCQTLCSQVKVLCACFLKFPLLDMAGDFLVTLFILKYELVKDEILYRNVHYHFIMDRILYQNLLSKQLTERWWSCSSRTWKYKVHCFVSSPALKAKSSPSHVKYYSLLTVLKRCFVLFSFLNLPCENCWKNQTISVKYQEVRSTGKQDWMKL